MVAIPIDNEKASLCGCSKADGYPKYCPFLRLVLRIRCDSTHAQLSFGARFGCDPETEAPALLKLAAELDLDVSTLYVQNKKKS